MVSRPALRLGGRLAILFAAGTGAQFAWSAGYLASLVLCGGLGVWAVARIASEALEGRVQDHAFDGHMLSALLQREGEARTLTAFLDHAPVPLLAMRARGALSAINLPARRAFGTDDVIIDPPVALVHHILGLEPGVRQSLSLDFSGQPRTYALTVAEVISDGDFVRIAALTDIQAEVQAAEAAALRELMLVLSHEIMNSMTPVTSLAESTAALLKDIDGANPRLTQAREAMDSLTRRARGLLKFVEGYRALARLPEPGLQPTDVCLLLEDMARLFRSRWAAAGVTLHTEIAPQLIRPLDPGLMSQAVLNILTNAAEAAIAASDEPQVSITARENSGRLMIEVSDNGPGFDVDEAVIFRPFFTTKSSGTGLGLSISRQIVQAHGGAIFATRAERTVVSIVL